MQDLPDIQSAFHDVSEPLPWVGLDHIILPIRFTEKDPYQLSRCSVGVNLASAQQRGIHMSRLYQILENIATKQPLLDPIDRLFDLHKKILESQGGISNFCEIIFHGYFCWEEQTLKSGLATVRSLPISLRVSGGEARKFFHFNIHLCYSSTCPQSFALSDCVVRQSVLGMLNQDSLENFELKLKSGSKPLLMATPHAQRSLGWIEMTWEDSQLRQWLLDHPVVEGNQFMLFLIKHIENVIVTISQNVVKREDEAQFAILNAQNTMFCEDAARRIHRALEQLKIPIFKGEVIHLESLHPFNVRACFQSTDNTQQTSDFL